jgi:hypothetical protein
MDVSLFLDRYSDLAALELGNPFFDPQIRRTILPVQNQNVNSGRGAGAEALVTYNPVPVSRISVSYSNLDVNVRTGGRDLNHAEFLDGATPRHQFGLRTATDLPARFQVDALLRHLAAIRRLPQISTGDGLPAYSELDLRLAWNGWNKTEISVVGQSLLHGHHPEFGTAAARGEMERGVYAKVAWGF